MVRKVQWSGERTRSSDAGVPDEDRFERAREWDIVPEFDDEDLPDLTTVDGWRRPRHRPNKDRPDDNRRHLSGADWIE
jgi:hypothetical protein